MGQLCVSNLTAFCDLPHDLVTAAPAADNEQGIVDTERLGLLLNLDLWLEYLIQHKVRIMVDRAKKLRISGGDINQFLPVIRVPS